MDENIVIVVNGKVKVDFDTERMMRWLIECDGCVWYLDCLLGWFLVFFI